MNKVLIANWKMNPAKEADAVKLAKASDAEGVIICAPFPFLTAVQKSIKKAQLGAQDACFEASGAFTGEVSPEQLKSMGVEYVILGHSERRAHLAETDEIIGRKVAAALEAGLTPVVCVGETRTQRDNGQTKEVVDRQVRMAFSLIPTGSKPEKHNAIIAYEPVWAISTNQTPAAPNGGEPRPGEPGREVVQDVINYMEGIVRGLPIVPAFIYGGSVNADNLGSFLECPEIHGALVGGASLKAAEFKKMISIASKNN